MRRLSLVPPERSVQVELDGEPVLVARDEPLALGLLAAGQSLFSRSIKYHRPRGAFCLEGSCGQCLMRVDGLPNVFTCRIPARSGMRLERQNAFPSAKLDLFAAVDFFFPGGLDHHHLMAGVPVAEDVMARVARQLAGTGQLPAVAQPIPAPARTQQVKLAIVGAGQAGQAAQAWLQSRSASGWTVCEREAHRTVLGVFQDGDGRFLMVRCAEPGASPSLLRLRFDRLLLATGGHAPLLPFENNDLPGIFTGEAFLRLLDAGIAPGAHLVLVGEGASLQRVERALYRAKLSARVLPLHVAHSLVARGGAALGSVSYRQVDGEEQTVPCDALGLCLPRAPRFELAHQAGVPLLPHPASGGFIAQADGHGRSPVPGVYIAGRLGGFDDAGASGERAVRAAWEDA